MTIPATSRVPFGAQSSKERTERVLRAFHGEEPFGRAYDFELLRRLWPFFAPQRKLLACAFGIVVVTSVGALVRPLILRDMIDGGVMTGDADAFIHGGLLLAGVILIEQVLGFVQLYATQVAGARAMSDLRHEVFAFLHRLPMTFFDNQPVGRLVSRAIGDVDAMLDLSAAGILPAVGDLLRLLGIVALMLALDWKLALIAFAATPLVMLVVVLVQRRMRSAFREIRDQTARMNATMHEQISGMTAIHAHNRQGAAGREFDRSNVAYRNATLRSIVWDALQDGAIDTAAALCLASLVASLAYRPVSFGTVIAFSLFISQFFEPIATLGQRYALLQSAMAGAERIFRLFDVDLRDCRPLPALPAARRDVALAFEAVAFSYRPGVPVLEEVSFRVAHGEKVALVGPTGSGKSTIAALALRLYDPERGCVRVQGEDAMGLDRTALRRQFAVVPQDVTLFPGTVATNVCIGEEPDPARVREALERLGALDVFASRPGGIDAPVGENGANFSAGERQLIAFARALYRDAPIVILDEATASLDSNTEAKLQRALDALLRQRTAIIIAHRLATIAAADRIVVLQRGQVVEEGSHSELMQRQGLYARLYELQFARS
jgi:ATP-binding cassette subfamily B protein